MTQRMTTVPPTTRAEQLEAEVRVVAFRAFWAADRDEKDPWRRFARALVKSCGPIRDRRAVLQLAALHLDGGQCSGHLRRGTDKLAWLAERLGVSLGLAAELCEANESLAAQCQAERDRLAGPELAYLPPDDDLLCSPAQAVAG